MASTAAYLSPHVDTRERILRAGVGQFQANGYHGTGVAAILAEAGAPKGCFYHHYPGGKEQLAVEAVKWLTAEVNAFLDRLNRSHLHGDEMTLEIARYAVLGLARPDRMRGSLIAVLAAEAVPGSSLIEGSLTQAVNGWIERLSMGFSRAGSSDARAMARTALAVVEGATMLARISGQPGDVLEITTVLLVQHHLSAT